MLTRSFESKNNAMQMRKKFNTLYSNTLSQVEISSGKIVSIDYSGWTENIIRTYEKNDEPLSLYNLSRKMIDENFTKSPDIDNRLHITIVQPILVVSTGKYQYADSPAQ